MLRFPYPRQVEEPSIYETVCVHTAMQTGRHENDLVPNAPAVSQSDIIQTYMHTHIFERVKLIVFLFCQQLGTKEGYLVKQGAIIKVWLHWLLYQYRLIKKNSVTS